MESRRISTRSSRRASILPVSPIKQAVMANILQGVGKTTVKKSSRKALADQTNAAPVTKMLPGKSSRKPSVVAAVAIAPIKVEDEVASPRLMLQLLEQQPATPVVVQGEELLRSLVHSNLAIIQTPNGPVRQSPDAETPQFGAPAALFPMQDTMREAEEVGAEVEASTPPKQEEEEATTPPVEASPAKEVMASVSERLSSAWVGCDVDEVPEIADDDDSDCCVFVNVSSRRTHLVASPAPASSIHPTTPRSAAFKWQRRDQLSAKVKEQESKSFSYYGGDDEYEVCDEFDGEDYDGEVIDCEEICEAISRLGVGDAGLPEHKGRHIRFNYNSDDEIVVEQVDVMRLRGVPTPRGKHLRFPEEEEG